MTEVPEGWREVPLGPVQHPLADRVRIGGNGAPDHVIVDTRARVVFLSADRINLLTQADREGLRVVLATDELTKLTPAFAEVWRNAGAAWVVSSPDGSFREGFSGRRLADLQSVFTTPPVREPDDVAIGYLRPAPTDAVELGVSMSVRHRPRLTTLLGGGVAGIAQAALGRPPHLYGPHEPVGTPWDRDGLTRQIRERMPQESLQVVSGPGLRATLVGRRTSEGVEEITNAQLSLGRPSTLEFERIRTALLDHLADLAEKAMPLITLVLARPGQSDLLIPPRMLHPPAALMMLIGAPAVRALNIPVDKLVAEHGARRVGRPRLPAVLLDLGTIGDPTWERLDAALAEFDGPELRGLLGLDPTAHRPRRGANGDATRPDGSKGDGSKGDGDAP